MGWSRGGVRAEGGAEQDSALPRHGLTLGEHLQGGEGGVREEREWEGVGGSKG